MGIERNNRRQVHRPPRACLLRRAQFAHGSGSFAFCAVRLLSARIRHSDGLKPQATPSPRSSTGAFFWRATTPKTRLGSRKIHTIPVVNAHSPRVLDLSAVCALERRQKTLQGLELWLSI